MGNELGTQAQPSTSAAVGKAKRERSAIEFPYDDLGAAEQIATVVHNRYGGRATRDQIAASLRSSSNSGAFRNKLSTARLFGFVEIDRDEIRLADLGMQLMDETRAAAARAEGFLRVPLYDALYKRFRGSTLPGDDGLEAVIRELGVATKQVPVARQAFQRSAEQAGFFLEGRNRLVMPPVGMGTIEAAPDGAEGEQADAVGVGKTEEDAVALPAMRDPLLAGILAKLPAPEQPFDEAEQEQWLSLAAMAMQMVYKSAAPAPQANGQPTRLNAMETPTGTGTAAGTTTGEPAG